MSSTADLDAARVRAGKNQSLFREVNERIEQLAEGNPSMFEELQSSRTIDLACECMDETCAERVTMTLGDYEQVRADSNSFFVLPGHDVLDVEEVVREETAYVIVRKLGVGAAVAQKLDPRKRRTTTSFAPGTSDFDRRTVAPSALTADWSAKPARQHHPAAPPSEGMRRRSTRSVSEAT